MSMNDILRIKYQFARTIVIDEGYQNEIDWQSHLSFKDLNESSFIREIAWVILTCGMKESIIRDRFDAISNCFFNWTSVKKIALNKEKCISEALKIFNNEAKMNAISNAAEKIYGSGFVLIKKKIKNDPMGSLREFDYIGPVTMYHLAKNIGLPVAKPDRHLVRIAQMENYQDVQTFCQDVSKLSGDSIPVVDLVYWRYATLERNYIDVLSSLNCNKTGNQNLGDTPHNSYNPGYELSAYQ
jgi:hypothetical protein